MTEHPVPSERAKIEWYAVYTRHQHEKVVAHRLSRKGFEVFLPLYTAFHRWQDRTKQLSLPLFPGYVFIRGGLERRLAVLTTPGIHDFAGNPGRPTPIPEAVIESVRRVLEGGTAVKPHPFLRNGDWVRVKSGPLAGIEGILVRKEGVFKLVLSVLVLEKSCAVEIHASMVEPVNRQSPDGLPL